MGGAFLHAPRNVQPDPASGMHCWHQKVTVEPAHAGDRYADVFVDTAKSRAVYAEWKELTKPAKGPAPAAVDAPAASAGGRGVSVGVSCSRKAAPSRSLATNRAAWTSTR